MSRRQTGAAAAVLALIVPALLLAPQAAMDSYRPWDTDRFPERVDVAGAGAENYTAQRMFPSFPSGNRILVVDSGNLTMNTDAWRLTLVSAQGLINRYRAEVYIDYKGEDDRGGTFLSALASGTGLPVVHIGDMDLLRANSALFTGIVVYDPARPETVNLATVYAGLENLLIADAGGAAFLAERLGLNITLDLRKGDFAGLRDAQAIARYSWENLYPKTAKTLLGYIPPASFKSRDLLIASRNFVFYVRPGPFAMPADLVLYDEIVSRTPSDIPFLAAFGPITGIEELYGVERASRAGKVTTGGINTPNLSLTTSMGPAGPFRQGGRDAAERAAAAVPPAGRRVYIAAGMADGDNLDFVYDTMREIWDSPARGRFPISWSLSPLLLEAAPSTLSFYYGSATENDSFIAAPSGAGYLYPDMTPLPALERHLTRTRALMERADMDAIWLLNRWNPYEPRYTPGRLALYVERLQPAGILLDYGDLPQTYAAWMQQGIGDSSSSAPVIKSHHLWRDRDNFVGKVVREFRQSDGPLFIYMAVFPWGGRLDDIAGVFESLRAELGADSVEAVTLHRLIHMVENGFVEKAGSGNPASPHTGAAQADLQEGNLTSAAYHSWRALVQLEDAERDQTALWLLALTAAALPLPLILILKRKKRPFRNPKSKIQNPKSAIAALAFLPATFILLYDVFKVIYSNIYDYIPLGLSFPVLVLLLFAEGPLRRAGVTPNGRAVTGLAMLVIPGPLLNYNPYPIPLAFAGYGLVFTALLPATGRIWKEVLVASYSVSFVLVALLPHTLPVLLASSLTAIAATVALPPLPVPRPPRDARDGMAGFALLRENARRFLISALGGVFVVVPLVFPFIPENHFFAVAAGGLAGAMDFVVPLALAAGLAVGLAVRAPWPRATWRRAAGLVLSSALLWLALPALHTLRDTAPVLMLSAVLWTVCALDLLELCIGRQRGNPVKFLELYIKMGSIIMVLCVAMVMPIIIYSRFFIVMPAKFVEIAYTTPAVFASLTLGGILPVVLWSWRFGPAPQLRRRRASREAGKGIS